MLTVSIVLLKLCQGQVIAPPAGFKIGSLPKNLEYSDSKMFDVRVERGHVVVSSRKEVERGKVNSRFEKFLGGELIAKDAGEFGGSLTYLTPNPRRAEVILKANVQAVGVIGSTAYALTGIHHLGYKETSIYQVTREGENWKVSKVAVPKEIPEFGCWVEDHFVYAGDTRLTKHGNYSTSYPTTVKTLSLTGQAKTIAKFDCNLYDIRSMVQDQDGTIWFGGLGFVAGLRPGGMPTFFVPLNGSKPRTGKGRTKLR